MLASLRTTEIVTPEYRATNLGEVLGFATSDGRSTGRVGGIRGAMSIPAFFRAAAMKADLVSSMPLIAVQDRQRLSVTPPIIARPNPGETVETTISKISLSLTTYSEAICVLGGIDLDVESPSFGRPSVLQVLDPSTVGLRRDDRGQRQYVVGSQTYSAFEIAHVVSFGLPGEDRGCGPLELHRRVLEGEIAMSEYNRLFYEEGAAPTVHISIEANGDVSTPAELEAFKRSWMSKLRARREPIVTPNWAKPTVFPNSNRDAMFIEGRTFSLSEIAMMAGVPAYFVGGSASGMTYSNAQDQRRDLLDLYLRRQITAIESLFTALLPTEISAEVFTDSFLKLDLKGTVETLDTEQSWMLMDEIRAMQNLAPLPNGEGQIIASHYVPGWNKPAPEPTVVEPAIQGAPA